MSASAQVLERPRPRVGRQIIAIRAAVHAPDGCSHRECAQALTERVATWANAITCTRTVAAVVLALTGARTHSLTLLLSALAAYWIGDIADGFVARRTNTETRFGAAMDIMCDRISAAVFYIGFAWYDPTMIVPVGIYLAEFMVVDMYLSMAFLAWPVSSPNYFYLINRRLWVWNWSKPGKATNSALFAVLMVATREPWLVGAIACALLAFKITSLAWLIQGGMPVPKGVCSRISTVAFGASSLGTRAIVMMPITTFGVAIISALCPLVNLELYMAGVGAFARSTGFWTVVLLAAAGQAMGKLFWYQVGSSSLKWSFIRRKTESPRWKHQFDKLKRQTEQRPLVGVGLVFASASAGLPPLAIMAVLTGQLHFSRAAFLVTTFVGRTVRFAAVLGGVSWFSAALSGAP